MARARHSCKTWWHSQPLVLQTKYFLKYDQSFDYAKQQKYRIRIRNLDADSGGQKWPTKIEKHQEISCFEVLNVLFWWQKASSVAWTVLNGGQGIAKLQILIKKLYIFSAVYFLAIFGHQDPESGSVFSLKMLNPDHTNPDPKHWRKRLYVGVCRLLGTEGKDWKLVCTSLKGQ
jgi:hypothetical protein